MSGDTARFLVLPGERIAQIHPYLHGHFAEHLGELIYPGIWVGPDSSIPNEDGLRLDIVEALRPLRIPVLRWPGGCFADDYHWRDGVGLRERRPVRPNRHWGMAREPNAFGLHEFIRLCRHLGAEPYIAGNVGSGTPAELRDWVEYCNQAGGTTLADERAANGSPEPFSVRLWGIGNENWGCGGRMSPEQYAAEYCRFRMFVRDHSDTRVHAVACGPNNADWDWTRRFLTWMRTNYQDRLPTVQAFAAHFYCGTAGTATEFTNEQWLELLARARALEGVILGHRALMDEHDPARRIELYFDEWGAWHPVEAGKPASGLYQQSTQRDACVAALSLDIFHRHADKVRMANIAQLINVLQALLLVEDDRCLKTPTYHVFDLYAPHRDAEAVRVESLSPAASDGGPSADWVRTRYLDGRPLLLRSVEGSASIRADLLCITLVNTLPDRTQEVEVPVVGAAWSGDIECRTLAADHTTAHNTFDHPDRVTLSPAQVIPDPAGTLAVTIPAGGIMRLRGRIRS